MTNPYYSKSNKYIQMCFFLVFVSIFIIITPFQQNNHVLVILRSCRKGFVYTDVCRLTIQLYVEPCCLLAVSDALKTHVEIIGTRMFGKHCRRISIAKHKFMSDFERKHSNSKQSKDELKWKE